MKKNILLLLSLSFLIGCQEILFVEDISDLQVETLAPTNNAVIDSESVTFSWQKVPDAEKYQIQIATPTFANASQILLDSLVVANSFTKNLQSGNYQWRVKGVNSGYETAYTTNTFSVSTTGITNKQVVLVNPIENLITNNKSQTLTWNSIDNATEYRIQIWNPDTSGTKVIDNTTTNTNINYTFADGAYTWQVRAQNATENSAYSSRSLLIDTTPPNTPTLDSPTNNSTLTNTSIDFKWTRNDINGSAETDSIYVFNDAALTSLNFKDKATTKSYTKTIASGTYYWVVTSFDKAGNKSTQSNSFTLTIN